MKKVIILCFLAVILIFQSGCANYENNTDIQSEVELDNSNEAETYIREQNEVLPDEIPGFPQYVHMFESITGTVLSINEINDVFRRVTLLVSDDTGTEEHELYIHKNTLLLIDSEINDGMFVTAFSERMPFIQVLVCADGMWVQVSRFDENFISYCGGFILALFDDAEITFQNGRAFAGELNDLAGLPIAVFVAMSASPVPGGDMIHGIMANRVIILGLERLGYVSFFVPSNWGAMISGMEPGMEPFDGSMFSTWDPLELDNQPVFQIQRWLIDEDIVLLDELLRQVHEKGHLLPDVSEVTMLFDDVYAAVVRGVNIDENSWYYGMNEYNIRFIYSGWLFEIAAWYGLGQDAHQRMLQLIFDSINLN